MCTHESALSSDPTGGSPGRVISYKLAYVRRRITVTFSINFFNFFNEFSIAQMALVENRETRL